MAGSYAEATEYAHRNGVTTAWVFLDDPIFLHGCYNPRVFRTGNWESLEKLKEIEEEILNRARHEFQLPLFEDKK